MKELYNIMNSAYETEQERAEDIEKLFENLNEDDEEYDYIVEAASDELQRLQERTEYDDFDDMWHSGEF